MISMPVYYPTHQHNNNNKIFLKWISQQQHLDIGIYEAQHKGSVNFFSISPFLTKKRNTMDHKIAKWFEFVKPDLLNKNPAATLPYLIDKDKVITECDAICIYLCQKNKPQLLGRDLEQKVALATVRGVYKEFYPAYIKLIYGNYNKSYTFEQALSESVENFNYYLTKINGLLASNQFVVGELTWFDFALADFLQTLSLLNTQYLKPFPKLVDYQQRVWRLPQLKDYFSSKRYSERPCNNYTAAWK